MQNTIQVTACTMAARNSSLLKWFITKIINHFSKLEFRAVIVPAVNWIVHCRSIGTLHITIIALSAETVAIFYYKNRTLGIKNKNKKNRKKHISRAWKAHKHSARLGLSFFAVWYFYMDLVWIKITDSFIHDRQHKFIIHTTVFSSQDINGSTP